MPFLFFFFFFFFFFRFLILRTAVVPENIPTTNHLEEPQKRQHHPSFDTENTQMMPEMKYSKYSKKKKKKKGHNLHLGGVLSGPAFHLVKS